MNLRSRIERLPPYPSLLLLGIPTVIVVFTKVGAVVVGGEGHWLGGMAFLFCAYGASAFGTERFFRIVKPRLLELPWFARVWRRAVRVYDGLRDWLRSSMGYSRAR